MSWSYWFVIVICSQYRTWVSWSILRWKIPVQNIPVCWQCMHIGRHKVAKYLLTLYLVTEWSFCNQPEGGCGYWD